MPEERKSATDSLIPAQPIPDGAENFTKQVHGLLDGSPKDDTTVSRALEGLDSMIDLIAAGLYSMASMLVGEGEDSIRVVETAVARAEVSACDDVKQARRGSRIALCSAAIETLAQRDPLSLAAPCDLEPDGTCIEEDDLSAAGISTEELETMLAGPNRENVKKWLASLPIATRTIFVLRAVAEIPSDETATLLARHGGPAAAGWTADGVRVIFRQGLCSLASQLVHAASAK